MKRGRLEYSILNSSISSIIYIGRLLIQFVARSLFIRFLGQTYLGLNGLFTNILSLLSMAELGVGASIVFSLYRPLAENDHPKITALMQLYRKAYDLIGVVIGVLGIVIMPFLPFIIKDMKSVPNVYIIYLLFLANSVVSYFFTYKRSLITADQKAYIVSLNDFIFLLLTNIVQIAFLYIKADFIIYLIIQIVFTILSNICISWIVDRRYPYLRHSKPEKIDQETTDVIKKNVLGNVSSTIGGQIVMGTDNILISAFVNLTAVGMYSNYTLVVNAIQNLCKQVTNSITASIGNFAVTASQEKNNELFQRHFFVNHTLIFFSATVLEVVLNTFIQWWVGPKNVLTSLTATLIIINYAIQVYRNTGFVFIQSFGLFWYQRKKPIIEAAVNLIASLLFLAVFKMGINGVLLGTILSSFGFVIWYEAYVVYKHALHRPLREYVVLMLRSVTELAFTVIITTVTANRILPVNASFVGLIVKTIYALVLTTLLYILFYHKRPEFKYLLSVGKRLIKRS